MMSHYKYWKDYEKPPILIVTGSKVEYDRSKAQVKDSQILIVTDEYDITIRDKRYTENTTNNKEL